MANSIWQRIDHKIWEVDQALCGTDPETDGFVMSPKFAKALLSQLMPDELEALCTDALVWELSSNLANIRAEGCTCEVHLAEYYDTHEHGPN